MKTIIISIFLTIILLVNVVNANAYVNVEVDQKALQKRMCEVDYEAEWKDGKCHFSGRDKNFDEREYEFDLRDVGVYDGYAERNNLKEKQLKELVNSEYDVDRATMDYYCGTSEDYEENKEQCDKLYDLLKDNNDNDD